MYHHNECIICFNHISSNDFIFLDCCKQIVHIECLNKWIKININNNEVKKCFYCKSNNDYINTIIYYTLQEEDIENNYDSDSNSLIETTINNSDNFYNYTIQKKYFLVLFNIISFFTITIVFTQFIINNYNENNNQNRRSLLSII